MDSDHKKKAQETSESLAKRLNDLLDRMTDDVDVKNLAEDSGTNFLGVGEKLDLPGDTTRFISCSGCGCACIPSAGKGLGCGNYGGNWA